MVPIRHVKITCGLKAEACSWEYRPSQNSTQRAAGRLSRDPRNTYSIHFAILALLRRTFCFLQNNFRSTLYFRSKLYSVVRWFIFFTFILWATKWLVSECIYGKGLRENDEMILQCEAKIWMVWCRVQNDADVIFIIVLQRRMIYLTSKRTQNSELRTQNSELRTHNNKTNNI